MFSSRLNVLTRAFSSANSCFITKNDVSICQRSQSTADAAYAALPFCEPAYVDIYGTLTFENNSIRGEIPLMPKE